MFGDVGVVVESSGVVVVEFSFSLLDSVLFVFVHEDTFDFNDCTLNRFVFCCGVVVAVEDGDVVVGGDVVEVSFVLSWFCFTLSWEEDWFDEESLFPPDKACLNFLNMQ